MSLPGLRQAEHSANFHPRYQVEIPDALIQLGDLVLPKMGVYRGIRNVINSFRSAGLIGKRWTVGTELPRLRP